MHLKFVTYVKFANSYIKEKEETTTKKINRDKMRETIRTRDRERDRDR